ncbi:MAG: hypothetical protein ACO35I_05225 [Burkholderiaceae bacterium]
MAWTPELEAEYQALEAQYGNQPAVPPTIATNPGANQKLLEAQAGALGKATGEQIVAGQKAQETKAEDEAKKKQIASIIDEAINKSDWWSTGLGAETLAGVGGTDAAQLNALLEPVRSYIAINRMKKLKEASPTGSTGFGALSEKELSLLTGEQGALSLGQGEKQLDETLKRIKSNIDGGTQDDGFMSTPSGTRYKVIK